MEESLHARSRALEYGTNFSDTTLSHVGERTLPMIHEAATER